MSKISFFALGGLGENGKNMYVLEVKDEDGKNSSDDIFILDAGLKNPSVDLYGVDAVLPDVSYIRENKDKVKGIFISHGHIDHIGGIIELLKFLNVGIFGSHFTISLIEDMLTEAKMDISKYRLYRINEDKVFRFGSSKVMFYNVNHSIPESMNVAIKTKDGVIVYAPDFTFDVTPNNKYQTSISKICDIGKEEVLAVCAESIGTANVLRVPNDDLMERAITDILQSSKRVVFTAYSEELSRIQKIIDLSVKNNRRIAIIGIKAQQIINRGIESGYLSIPEDKLVSLKYIDGNSEYKNDDDDLVVIVTGLRHKPFYMIQRMCRGQDRLIEITSKDHIVFASPASVGTEKISARTIDAIYRADAKFTNITKNIMRSSHADSEDLTLLYKILNPKYIIPIIGEYRHLYSHKKVAEKAGFDKNRVIILENGQVATFIDGKLQDCNTKVRSGDVLVDGSIVGDINGKVLKDREVMGEEGLIVVNMAINKETMTIKSLPDVICKGVVTSLHIEEVTQKITDLVFEEMASQIRKHKKVDWEYLEDKLVDLISQKMKRLANKYPKVIVTLIDCK